MLMLSGECGLSELRCLRKSEKIRGEMHYGKMRDRVGCANNGVSCIGGGCG